ncbi:ACT domain-containing protein [Chitinibacter fontanus]|uniref:ACT domain-containing protein n=1 Tax=Chitinibacter fontanus TaxID=1737446 RepID=UPI001D150A1A|nr:ACT domain-containing protein [Chitinibacter fontanus]
MPEDFVRAARATQYGEGILIEGIDKLMTMLAKCCKPVPPDAVMGYVTKGRGISIHRCDCAALKRLAAEAPERLIRADWGNLAKSGHVFAVDILVEATERASLLRDLTDIMSREKINVSAANMQVRDGRARIAFTIEIRDNEQLQRIFARLLDVPSVLRCARS